jgi:hypothetical protein
LDHVTLLCSSNMSGTHIQKLLVIGKRGRPQWFKGIIMDGLPVLYYANKNVWMTSEIFKICLWVWMWNYNRNWGQFYWFLATVQHTLTYILWKISKWNFCLWTPHTWYSQRTRESYWIWRPYIPQSW